MDQDSDLCFHSVCNGIKELLSRMHESLRVGRKYNFSGRKPSPEDKEDMRKIAKEYPGAIRHYARFDPANRSVLQILCRMGASLPTVKATYEAYPDALFHTNRYSYLPIHNACRRDAPLDVIQVLVEKHPESLLAGEQSEETPLHFACYGGLRPWRVPVINDLLSVVSRSRTSI